MSVRRFASISSALLVGAIAALASYSHMRHLAIQYGQDRLIATLLPISVDGMMVVATVALGDGRRFRWSAWLAFWTGVAASVVANVLAAEPSAIARCISAWPAVAFLLVVEVITRGGRFRTAEAGRTSVGVVVGATPTEPRREPDGARTEPGRTSVAAVADGGRPADKGTDGRPQATVDDVRRLVLNGVPLTRDAMAKRLRTEGYAAPNNLLGALVREVKTGPSGDEPAKVNGHPVLDRT